MTSLNPFLITFAAVLLFIVVLLSVVNNCSKEQREQGDLESLHLIQAWRLWELSEYLEIN